MSERRTRSVGGARVPSPPAGRQLHLPEADRIAPEQHGGPRISAEESVAITTAAASPSDTSVIADPQGAAGIATSTESPTSFEHSPSDARAKGWRAWLAGASPREVLARLMCGDPLDLRSRIASVLDERAYLIEHDRLHLRAVARVARAAPRYRGQPDLDPWLRRHVEEALDELLEESEPDEPSPTTPWGLEGLARPLGIEPASARAACLAFNRLPLEERKAFRALVLEGRSLDDLAAHPLADGRPASATEIARAARRALERVCAAAGLSTSAARPLAVPSRPPSATPPPPSTQPPAIQPPSTQKEGRP